MISGATTNLFVATQYDRFNFRISSGRGFDPDYVLKIRRKAPEPDSSNGSLRVKAVNLERKQNGMHLKLLTVTTTTNNFAVIYNFEVRSDRKRNFQPGNFEVLQAGRSLPIENIYLERLVLEKGQTLQGMIVVLRSHVRKNQRTAIRVTSQNPISKIVVSAPEI